MAHAGITAVNREYLKKFQPVLFAQTPKWATHYVVANDSDFAQVELARHVARFSTSCPHEYLSEVQLLGHNVGAAGYLGSKKFHYFFIVVEARS